MVDAIRRCFPEDINYTKPEGGMFLWVTLPEGMSALSLLEKAVEKKVAFVPGDPFYIDEKNVNTLRLNYTNSNEQAIDTGIRLLAEAIRDLAHQLPVLL